MQVSCGQCGEAMPANAPCNRCGFFNPDPSRIPGSIGAPLAVYFHPVLAFCAAVPAGYSLVPEDFTEAVIYRFAAVFFLLLDLPMMMDAERIQAWCAKHTLLRWINGIAFLVPGASLIWAGLPMVTNIVVATFKNPLVLVDAWWLLLGFGSFCGIGVAFLFCAYELLIQRSGRGNNP